MDERNQQGQAENQNKNDAAVFCGDILGDVVEAISQAAGAGVDGGNSDSILDAVGEHAGDIIGSLFD